MTRFPAWNGDPKFENVSPRHIEQALRGPKFNGLLRMNAWNGFMVVKAAWRIADRERKTKAKRKRRLLRDSRRRNLRGRP